MNYEVDENYLFDTDENGFPFLPNNLKKEKNLYILPNGKYLPCGCYMLTDGSSLIYEPSELSTYGKLLRENVIK